MNIVQLTSVLSSVIESEEAREKPIIIWGPPGIGKTDMFHKIARDKDCRYMAFLTATMDPTDVVGIPHPINGVTQFLPPADFNELTTNATDQGPVIACFDDLPAGNESVFNSLLRFFHNREVAGSRIRDNIFICATGNRAEDMAGARALTTALSNRFVHFDMEVDFQAWKVWAIQNNICPEILGFLQTRPNMLHDFNPEREIREFPTPRSIASVSSMQKALGFDHDNFFTAVKGCVGEAWALEYRAFITVARKAIPPSEILADPENAPVPNDEDIDIIYATTSGLVHAISKSITTKNLTAGFTYAKRLGLAEFTICTIQDLAPVIEKATPQVRVELIENEIFTNLSKKYSDYLTLTF